MTGPQITAKIDKIEGDSSGNDDSQINTHIVWITTTVVTQQCMDDFRKHNHEQDAPQPMEHIRIEYIILSGHITLVRATYFVTLVNVQWLLWDTHLRDSIHRAKSWRGRDKTR